MVCLLGFAGITRNDAQITLKFSFSDERRRNLRVVIDHEQCIGDGICVDTCPEVFEMRDDGLAYVIADPVPPEAEAKAREAAEACPTVAIEIE